MKNILKYFFKHNFLIVFCLIINLLTVLETQARTRNVTSADDEIILIAPTGTLRWAITGVGAQDGDTILIAPSINEIRLKGSIGIRNTVIILKIGTITTIKTNTFTSTDYQLFNTNTFGISPVRVIFVNINFNGTGNAQLRAFAAGTNIDDDIRFLNCQFEKFIAVAPPLPAIPTVDNGVAIKITKGRLTLNDCTFQENKSLRDGVVYYDDISNDLEIRDAVFKNNTALDGFGGAIYTKARRTTILFSVFEGNTTTNTITPSIPHNGGAIYAVGNEISIRICTFTNNRTLGVNNGFGGAICTFSKDLEVLDCIFIGNTGKAGGGAMYVDESNATGKIRIERCYFRENKTNIISNNSGGAIYLTHNVGVPIITPILIRNCTFYGNEAYEGGGVFLFNMQSQKVNIISNTFIGNVASSANSGDNERGGAIQAGNAQECLLDYNVAIGSTGKDFAAQFALKTKAGNNVYNIGSTIPNLPSAPVNPSNNPFGINIVGNNPPTTNYSVIDLFENVLPQPNRGFSDTFKPNPTSDLLNRTPTVASTDLPAFDQRLFPRGTTIDVGACERNVDVTQTQTADGILVEITDIFVTSNGIKIEWRDFLDAGTNETYDILRNQTVIGTITRTLARKQEFTDNNPVFNEAVAYQIKAKKTFANTNYDYRSQKVFISFLKAIINANDTQSDKEVSIYPNPCKEKLFISLEKTLNLSKENKISIFSIFGQKIISQNISLQQTEVVLPENLRVGLYFVEIKQGEKRSIKKIIIE